MLGTRGSNRLVTIVATVVSFIFVTFLVVGSSRAAFSASANNTGNSIGTATVSLSTNMNASAFFVQTEAVPEVDYVRCINVIYDGSFADLSQVRLSGSAAAVGTQPLISAKTNLKIERVNTLGDPTEGAACAGASGGTELYSGPLSSFVSSYPVGGAQLDTGWTPAAGAVTETYRMTARLAADTPQNGAVSFGFQWEVTKS